MPKITNFVFCKPGQFETEGSGLDLIDTVITSEDTFKVAVAYSITDFSVTENHSGFLKLMDPSDDLIIQTDEFQIEQESDENIESNEGKEVVSGITMAIEFGNVQFRGPGLYKAVLYFDNKFLADFYIPVFFNKESDGE